MKRQFAALCLIGVAAYGTYAIWDNQETISYWFESQTDREVQDYKKAQTALAKDDYEEVFALAIPYAAEMDQQTPAGQRWLNLLIRTAEQSKNMPRLVLLYEYNPQVFTSHEKASLLAANGYLVASAPESYDSIRSLWLGREGLPTDWYLLDVDRMLQEGKRSEALDMLRSKRFESGKADARRSIRLAALVVMEDPKHAWEALKDAEQKDPTNSDVYLYKGRLLQSINRHDLAINEYLDAVKYSPQNPHLWELLGDQYLAIGQNKEAIDAYRAGLNKGNSTSLWLKTYFWTKVAYPKNLSWSTIPIPPSDKEPLLEYYLQLPEARYWGIAGAHPLVQENRYISSEPTAFWLRLLGDLQDKNFAHATVLLEQQNSQAFSWQPSLFEGLRTIAALQKEKPAFTPNADPQAGNFLDFLNKPMHTWPQWVYDLAQTKDAYPIALIEAGWLNSGLQLLSTGPLPDSRPDALVVEIMEAYQTLDGQPKRAIAYGLNQKRTGGLTLTLAQLYYDNLQTKEAINLLRKVPEDNPFALQVQEKLLHLYLSENEWEEAKRLVEKSPNLEKTVQGKEVLAKQALEEGDISLAAKLYSSIVEQSADAKGFLARKAFNDKDYTRAKLLTEQLIQLYPESVVLKENLKKILQEQENIYN